MRISERKRRIRERSTSPIVHTAVAATPRVAPVERPAKAAKAARSRQTGPKGAVATNDRSRRQIRTRGPRFYAGFGVVGLAFSAILAITTYTNYQSRVDKYHAALKLHKVATAPVLSLTDFLLPLLYGGLSIAYLYLAYRTIQQRQKAQTGGTESVDGTGRSAR